MEKIFQVLFEDFQFNLELIDGTLFLEGEKFFQKSTEEYNPIEIQS